MKIIKKLSKQISDEIEGMEDYAKCALEWRKTDPELSKAYYDMAKAEHTHAQRLHELVMRKIEEAKASGIEPPQSMLNAWEDKHRELIEKSAMAKVYLDMYK